MRTVNYYYLVPLTSQALNGQTIVGPSYLQTDMAGLGFSCIPFGQEGLGIVSLAAANAALAAESDVFAIPSDLTETLVDADVMNLTNFLTPLNVPVSQFISGMTWAEALQTLATLFLAAQAISGALGTSIFGDGSTTLDTAISDSSISALAPSQNESLGHIKSGGSIQQQQVTSNGLFDFSAISASDTVGDTLDSLSAQFTSAVVF